MKVRLSPFARIRSDDSGYVIETRFKTGSGHSYGEANRVHLSPAEARELYDALDDKYGDGYDG